MPPSSRARNSSDLLENHPWSYEETKEAAWKTVNAIHKLGLNCCFFGGMGAKLHGNPRNPNDIDIIILDTPDNDVGVVKQLLAARYQYFYLTRSQNPAAVYQILWYKIDNAHSCKVDVLAPGGDLRIPEIPCARIEWSPFLPVAPFSVVFLLKLQGWSDHRASLDRRKRRKQHMDHEDVEYMLDRALEDEIDPLNDPIHAEGQFGENAIKRCRSYVKVYPESRWKWERLGFPPSIEMPEDPDLKPKKEGKRKAKVKAASVKTSRAELEPGREPESSLSAMTTGILESSHRALYIDLDEEIDAIINEEILLDYPRIYHPWCG